MSELWNFAFTYKGAEHEILTNKSTTSKEQLQDPQLPSAIGTKEGSTSTAAKLKYTPLELQFLDLKKGHADAILIIQCGYKYRIFGEDAQVASKALGIGCFMNHNFLSASFPCHRLFIHVRKLVALGYKVGVVRQTESTALKALGESRNSLFSRKLDALYTQSTFIEAEADDVENLEIKTDLSLYDGLVCIIETQSSNKDSSVEIGLVGVKVNAGEVYYASFMDCALRSQLENCLYIMRPVEFLLPMTSLSETTELLIKNFLDMRSLSGCKIRLERMDDDVFMFTNAIQKVSAFVEESSMEAAVQESALNLHPSVICCLSPLISYLTNFNLENLLKNPKHFKPLETTQYMSYNPPAIRSSELFENLSDFQERGSLLWTLNYTRTKFGKKLLRKWILQPLIRLEHITERQDVVEEILHSNATLWMLIEKMLSGLPDMERLLSASFFHRCTCSEFVLLGKGFIEIRQCILAIMERMDLEIRNNLLRNIFTQICNLTGSVEKAIENIDEEAARKEDKSKIFLDPSMYPEIVVYQNEMIDIKGRLNSLKTEIAKLLHLAKFEYSSVMVQNYLIEVKNSESQHVPNDWIKINSTKQVSRFRSPEVETLCRELDRCTENLQMSCNEAWHQFLSSFGKHFYQLKKLIECVATLDCLLAFARLAKEKAYCRPSFSEGSDRRVNIVEGKNPIVCSLIGEEDQYIANDTSLLGDQCCLILTGPNMGGKSSYARQLALIAILSQIGSYVPAESACLPIFDGIYVRMGAEDNLCTRRSTFMTEMEETSVILSKATSNSLVILDELGRGTSSHDGAAIAHATLLHLISVVKCKTLFVTHYPDIAHDLQSRFPNCVKAYHMSFYATPCVENGDSSEDHVTFLYSMEQGIAKQSYGINVARLAGIPNDILCRAKTKSQEMEKCAKKIRLQKEEKT